ERLTARNHEDRVVRHERQHSGRVAALARPHPGLNHLADRLLVFGHLTLHWWVACGAMRRTRSHLALSLYRVPPYSGRLSSPANKQTRGQRQHSAPLKQPKSDRESLNSAPKGAL